MTNVMRDEWVGAMTFDTGHVEEWFRLCAGRHCVCDEWLAHWKTEDCYGHVSPGHAVVRADGSFNRAGGKEIVDRPGGGGDQQRRDLCDRAADGTVRVHSREFILYRGLCGESALVEEGAVRGIGHGGHRDRRETNLSELGDRGPLLCVGGDVPAVPVAQLNFCFPFVEDDGAAGADLALIRKVADVVFVVAPDDEIEDRVRIGLVDVDEGGRAVARRGSVCIHDFAADGAVLADVLGGFSSGEDGRRGWGGRRSCGWSGALSESQGQAKADEKRT